MAKRSIGSSRLLQQNLPKAEIGNSERIEC